jgi:hypothetical protein
VQKSPSDHLDWFRVHFLSLEGHARNYGKNRPHNDVFGGNACRSRFGPGVGPARQPHRPFVGPGSKLHPGS